MKIAMMKMTETGSTEACLPDRLPPYATAVVGGPLERPGGNPGERVQRLGLDRSPATLT